MTEMTKLVYDYLIELDENEAADFLVTNCSTENQYVDTLFDLVGDGQTDMFDLLIYVSARIYKNLGKYSKVVTIIENSINDIAPANGMYIRKINWFPKVENDKKISLKTISYLKGIITGDSEKSDYMTGPELVNFFNTFGFKDVYQQGFPSRWKYTEEKLIDLNNRAKIAEVIENYYNPVNFIENKERLEELIEELNKYLLFDNLKAGIVGKKCKVTTNTGTIGTDYLQTINHEYINETIEKCDKKIFEGDYSGAITNARSLVESILIHIKTNLTGEEYKFTGDLNLLYREVAKELNLTIEKNSKIDGSFKKVISGFFSIISGIAEIGNELGDRHGKGSKRYRAERRHALLVVNAAKTFCEFIFNSFEQRK